MCVLPYRSDARPPPSLRDAFRFVMPLPSLTLATAGADSQSFTIHRREYYSSMLNAERIDEHSALR
jgi:hypothetical protein